MVKFDASTTDMGLSGYQHTAADRFMRYVQVDTQSDPASPTQPSTEKQKDLSRILVEELKAVFDPQGGYFKSGGRFMPSLVAEIGDAIEAHMKHIGLITPEEPSEYQKQLLQEKRKEYEDRHNLVTANNEYPSSAELCLKCHTKAVIVMDGCKTCLSCGNSKCG